jgi:ankyrin repeat protein
MANEALLQCAVRENDFDAVSRLLGVPAVLALVDATDEFGQTALGYAVALGNAQNVDLLLDVGGADVNALTENGTSTALLMAALKGDAVVTARLLANRGIKVDKTKCFLRSINYKYKNSDYIYPEEPGTLTALHCAVMSGSVETLRLLLEQPGIPLNSGPGGADSRSVLFFAAGRGELHMCELLVAKGGTEIFINRPPYGMTALMIAASMGELEICKFLVGVAGIDLAAVDRSGRDALAYAVHDRKVSTCRFLLQLSNAAHLNRVLPGPNGLTLLMYAVVHNYAEICSTLLSSPLVDINAAGRHGRTALHLAATEPNRVEILTLLLRTPGVLVNKLNSDGLTPIMAAVRRRYFDHPGGWNLTSQRVLLRAPGVDIAAYLKICLDFRNLTALMAESAGRLDLRGTSLNRYHLDMLDESLDDSVFSLDIRENPDIDEHSEYVLQRLMANHPGIMVVHSDIQFVFLQLACAAHQKTFMRKMKMYLEVLRQYTVLDGTAMPSEMIARIGADAYPEHFVHPGPDMYERARRLIFRLLEH